MKAKKTYTILMRVLKKNELGNAWFYTSEAKLIASSTSWQKLEHAMWDEILQVAEKEREQMEDDRVLDDIFTFDHDFNAEGELVPCGFHNCGWKWEFTIIDCKTI